MARSTEDRFRRGALMFVARRSSEQMKSMFDDDNFAKMYASAEKLTGHFAKILVDTVVKNISDNEELVILDEACGTGIVSKHLMDALGDNSKKNLELTCADNADAMLKVMAKRIETNGWEKAKTAKSDGIDTKLPSSHFTHILLNFGPMIFSDSKKGMGECHRMLRPGGTLAMTSWEEVGWMPDVRAAMASDPELPGMAPDHQLRKAFSADGAKWDEEPWVHDFVSEMGFVDVRVEKVKHRSSLSNVTEFMGMIQGVFMLLVNTQWTGEQKEKYRDRAKDVIEKYMVDKYGKGEIQWDWVALMTIAKKAA
ncbi:hypothetical protein LTR47_005842 [Exophiala xenobiotica]|nr:hypothetical protein LTR41_006439 [Exophiala xenobiotica]KAK5232978.1 hypothetical protein LTR47_005842 [Exophiala xenobiotica]KAK5243743.1 hypothetical protein LTS06_010558 [Exophiala xenobiotica]KAK5322454.1 hypothetical protein LTR93_005657 [Exophiala xenobiotica]KAK5350980.1 hypothetical protein LTR61_005333 [Exophiala xenobiotica]